VPLIVDNAHGAYLRFLENDMHPITEGAAMCADSAHKTLPVLTGGAYLHISRDYPEYTAEAMGALSLFASTSPSYLTLQSLDLCNAYIANGYQARLESLIKKLSTLKDALTSLGFSPIRSEELKIVFAQKDCGYSGYELARILSDFGIEPEFADRDFLVLMVTPENTDSDLERVYSAFASLERRTSSTDETSLLPCTPVSALSIREAVFSSSETVNVEDAEGRICASPTVSCPPAVPIAVSGEMIDKAAIDMFKYYGIEKIEVVK
jgi:arginine/lysine/ornithine decarboxylase